jgi:ketosteroid isomerase-like protein
VSRENVEIVRASLEAFERGGLDRVHEYYDPEIEWHEDPSFPEAGVYRGLAAVDSYQREFLSEFSEIHYEPRELIERGDHVVANLRIHGRGKASGAEFDISAWWACAVREGRVVRVYAYLDRDRALEAVDAEE